MLVFLDNKPVSFEGSVPSSLVEVLKLLSSFLEEEGKCVCRCVVDGVEIFSQKVGDLPTTCHKIEAYSGTEEVLLKNQILIVLNNEEKILKVLEEFSKSVLSAQWAISLQKNNEVIEKLLPLVKLFEALFIYASKRMNTWEATLKDFLKAFNHQFNLYTSAVALKDPIMISELIAYELIALVQEMYAFISEVIYPQIECKVPEHDPTAC